MVAIADGYCGRSCMMKIMKRCHVGLNEVTGGERGVIACIGK